MQNLLESEIRRTPRTTERMLGLSGFGLLGAGVSAVALIDPTKVNFLPVCPMLSLTGFACPGCGLTRGFHALFHGDVMAALDFNILLPVWAFVFGYLFLNLGMMTVRGRWLKFNIFTPTALWAFLAVSLVFAVVRNLPFYPFSILYP